MTTTCTHCKQTGLSETDCHFDDPCKGDILCHDCHEQVCPECRWFQDDFTCECTFGDDIMWNGSVVGSVEPGNAERTYDAAVVVEDGELVFDMEVEGEWVSVPETLTTYHVVGPMPDYVRDRLEKNGFSLTKR